ncbi:MAG: aldehyde ferredoxin oxidoreductase family protein [Pirellulaceae bacterium]|nr:aldehyde ferredoxin oxidoreductase family protein [Pirellulaceae bacterium]
MTRPPPGYHGQYLRIDVSTGEVRAVGLPEDVLRRFLGGSGLGTWLLLDDNSAACDPLAPAAPLAFVFSPLVGSPLTTSAKFAVVSKSPLTERINDSLASSGFAIAGKRTGADALVIVGRAPRLSILLIDDGQVRLEPADDLAGLACPAAEAALRARVGNDYSYAVIGPAGERLVRYATISHDGRHAGRGGSGAVLGAKNIKAIAVRGTKRATWAQPQQLAAYAKDLSARSFGPATAKYRELGTASNLLVFNRLSALPTRNFQAGSIAGAEALAPETLAVARTRTQASCAACTIGCEHLYGLRRTDSAGDTAQNVRLEYENLFALGPLCGVTDPDVVLAASHRCDELGIDTISAGGTIAFAMECAERGLLDEPWIRFGEGDAILRAIELVGSRQGIGDLLAEGSRRAAQSIGRDSLDFAPQVKGLEIPGYEPRALQTMALGFAVGSRGADHNRSGAYEADFSAAVDRRKLVPDVAELAIATEDKAALLDSLILCKFLRGVLEDFYGEAAEMLALVTGWDVTADEMRTSAERIVTAKKVFNRRAGWTPGEDTLPPRMLAQALDDDERARLSSEQLAAAVRSYNLSRGWTAEGVPTPATLERLALADI